MKKFKLWIDDAACWGCQACEVACKQENAVPIGIKIIHVEEIEPTDVEEKRDYSFKVAFCRHCEDAPCVEACPVEAIEQLDNGMVHLNPEECTGCQACMEACPYGAIAFDVSANVALKCNLCGHRVEKGLVPACADNICPAHCIYFSVEE